MRVADPADESMLLRVRGQVADLDVSLDEQLSAPVEISRRMQLEQAERLAIATDARVVIWVVRLPHELEIVVADVERDWVLVRELGHAEARGERSAQEEAAAIVVRTAIKASLAGTTFGKTQREVAASELSAITPNSRVASVAQAAMNPDRRFERPTERSMVQPNWSIGLCAWLGTDGQSAKGVRSLSARGSWIGRGLEVGLFGAYGFRAEVEEPFALIRFAQHRVAAQLGWPTLVRREIRLSFIASAGVSIFSAQTQSLSDDFVAFKRRRTLMMLEAGATIAYTPAWARWLNGQVRAGVALRAAATIFVRPLELGYKDLDDKFIYRRSLWAVQPMAGVESHLVF
jgi:hypothetical protein